MAKKSQTKNKKMKLIKGFIKKNFLLVLAVFMMVGCYQAKAYHDKKISLVGDYRLEVIEYQGCEYVVIESYYQKRVAITHKGNCRFCKERRQKELEELVKQLKEKNYENKNKKDRRNS